MFDREGIQLQAAQEATGLILSALQSTEATNDEFVRITTALLGALSIAFTKDNASRFDFLDAINELTKASMRDFVRNRAEGTV